MTNPLKIIFLGTPEFAVATLQTLVENGVQVVAVITAPDKPSGRGLKLAYSPVKEYALTQNLPVLQPTNLKSEAFLEELRSYRADLQVVVAFRMLPEAVWRMPRLGTFNIHASLLPQYRGAAPINWAIINGETETGVSSFFLKHEIDTGDLIFQERTPISESDTAGTLYERLMHMGAQLALRTVRAIETGNYPTLPQQTDQPIKHAPKIFKDDCRISWSQPGKKVYDFIRGLSPYPCAFTTLHDKQLKVFRATYSTELTPEAPAEPGQHISDGKTHLSFRTTDGLVHLEELQLEGKKRMGVEEFLRGVKLDGIK